MPICQHCTETNGKLMMICLGCSFLRCLEFRYGDFSKFDVYLTQMWLEEKYVLQQKISQKKSSFTFSWRLTQNMKDNKTYRGASGDGHGSHLARPESHGMLWVGNTNVSALRDKNLTT